MGLLHFKRDQPLNTPHFPVWTFLQEKRVFQQNSVQIQPFCLRGSRDKQRAQCVYFANIAAWRTGSHTRTHITPSVLRFIGPFGDSPPPVAVGHHLNLCLLLSFHRSTFTSPLWTRSWSLPSSPAFWASSCWSRYCTFHFITAATRQFSPVN